MEGKFFDALAIIALIAAGAATALLCAAIFCVYKLLMLIGA